MRKEPGRRISSDAIAKRIAVPNGLFARLGDRIFLCAVCLAGAPDTPLAYQSCATELERPPGRGVVGVGDAARAVGAFEPVVPLW